MMSSVHANIYRSWIIIVMAMAAMILGGCGGGGGGGGGSETSAAGVAGVTKSGIAVDPYISGAVFEEIPASGGIPLQESTPSDPSGNFVFQKNLTPGSILQMKQSAKGMHNGVPFTGTLKRVVNDTGTLVVSPLTTLVANGLSIDDVVMVLRKAGLESIQSYDVTADPMAGLANQATVSSGDLVPLQAAMAVNSFFQVMGDYGVDSGRVLANQAILANMVALAKETLNPEVLNSILGRYQKVNSGSAVVTSASQAIVDLELKYLLRAAVNINDTVVAEVRTNPALNPAVQGAALVPVTEELAIIYYIGENRGVSGVEEAIAGGILPNVQVDQVPVLDPSTGVVSVATSYGVTSPSIVGTPPVVNGPLRVFPGADGYGTTTKAGRGGRIVKVTNLNDSGPGSLRAALAESGPRIVVFEVSGAINLSSNIIINNPFLTIAGQTAPAPGIMLKNHGIDIQTNDVLIQHIAIRLGDLAGQYDDAITIHGSNYFNIVIDHCSLSWAKDEQVSIYVYAHDISIINSIVSEGLGEKHGMLIGQASKNITVKNNLFAHNADRNPALKGGTKTALINNVVYNGGGDFSYLHDDYSEGNIDAAYDSNVFLKGPSYNTSYNGGAIVITSNVPSGSRVYSANNFFSGVNILRNYASAGCVVANSPIDLSLFSIEKDLTRVRTIVASSAGARPAQRDSVDLRIVADVQNGTGAIPSIQPNFPVYAQNYRVFNPGTNPNGDDDGDGYTNVEEILHQLAAQVEGR